MPAIMTPSRARIDTERRPQTAAYVFEAPDWRPPGLENAHPFWLPAPWSCWMAPAQVNPLMALQWIELNAPNNRNVIPSLVDQICGDLSTNKALPSHQGVAFNQGNQMFDGQNRLHAIVQANTPMWLLVFWGVNDGTMAITDTGRSRTIAASARIAGKDFGSRHVAIINRANKHVSFSPNRISRTRLFELIDEHRTGLDWTIKHVQTAPFNRADVSAAIFRAYYNMDEYFLERFCRILRTGVVEVDADKTILMLRDSVMRGDHVRTQKAVTPSQNEMARYYKTLRTILAAKRGEHISKLQTPIGGYDRYQDVFPIPADVATWEAKGKPRKKEATMWPTSGAGGREA